MADIAELIVALKLQDGVSSGLGRLNGQLKGMGGGLSQVGKGIGQVGSGLDRIATRGAIAAAGGLAAVVTTASSMEEAFIGVQKTVDETAGVSFEQLRQQLRGMSSDTGTAFEELSRIGEIGGALGVGIESLDEFIDVVNRLSVSTDLTADTAATALGQLGTILHLQGSEFESFADTLVALGNAGASTEPQIVDLAARFAAAGNRAGLSSDEVLALSSAVASMGVEVEAGGTALSQTFNEIALAIGTGGEEVEAFTDLLGINAAEFRRRWERDALGTFQDFLKEISKLPPIEQAVALEAAGITGARQLSAIGLMADNYGFVAEQLEVARSATGELGEESDKFFGSSARGFDKLKENLRLAADTIGVEVLPIVNELGKEFITFLQDPATQRGLKEFGVSLASGIRDFVEEVRQADFGPLIDTMKGAAEVARGAFDLFNRLPEPLKQLAIAALVTNKLTGGAVFQIAGGLANIFGGALKTIHAAHVTVIGAGGGLPGGPTPPGGGGRVGAAALNIAKFVLGPAAAAILGAEIAAAINEQTIGPARDAEKERVDVVLEGANVRDMVTTLASIDSQLNSPEVLAQVALIASRIPFIQDALGNVAPVLEGQAADLVAALEEQGLSRAQIDRLIDIAQTTPAEFGAALRVALAPTHGLPAPKPTVAGGGYDPNVVNRDSRPDPRKTIPAVLPDTAMAPMVAGLATVNTSVVALSPITAAVERNRTETSTRLLALSGNYAGTNARLDRSNASLATIAAKNPAINLTNINNIRLSPTVIHQRIVQQNVISGFTSNDNSAGI